MAIQGWFNENEARAYPFLAGSVGREGTTGLRNLPNGAIVDCGFMVGTRSGFITETHIIYLVRLRRQGVNFFFDFESDAPGLFGVTLTFQRSLGQDKWVTEHLDSGMPSSPGSESSASSASAEGCEEPLWAGFLVTGSLSVLDAYLPGDGTVERQAGDAVVEPALIQNLSNSYVTSVTLANDDRTRFENPIGCEPVVWPYEIGSTYINSRCLLEDLFFRPGYHSVLRQDARANSIEFAAVVGAGEGTPCAEVPVFAGEVPPAGSNLFTGGPRCNEVIRTINGRGGPAFRIFNGGGMSIIGEPSANRLVINVSMIGHATCAQDGGDSIGGGSSDAGGGEEVEPSMIGGAGGGTMQPLVGP